MYMWMIYQRLTPRMLCRYDPRLPANMLFILKKLKQRIPYRSKQDIRHQVLIPQPYHIQIMRYREDLMIMSALQ